jgi:acetyl-CoA carboxylase biotin carboxylase subunit
MPSVGRIRYLREPAGPGIRNDSGIYAGFDVPVHYDAMLAKLIAWGGSREEAIARAKAALIEYRVEGPTTNIPFLRWILAHPDFAENRVHTRWLESVQDRFEHIGVGHGKREQVAAIAAAIYAFRSQASASREAATDSAGERGGLRPWVASGRARRLGKRRCGARTRRSCTTSRSRGTSTWWRSPRARTASS